MTMGSILSLGTCRGYEGPAYGLPDGPQARFQGLHIQQMAKRYGFIYVKKYDDGAGDLSRLRKDSFYWHKKVIAGSGQDLD